MSEFPRIIEDFLRAWGASPNIASTLGKGLVVAAIIAVAILANFVAKGILLRGLRELIERTNFTWDDVLLDAHVFDRLSHVAPAVVIHASAEVMFPDSTPLQTLTTRVSVAYMILIAAFVIDAALNAGATLYERSFDSAKERPIKSYVQLSKIFVTLVTGILVLGTLLDRSPWGFLSGLGAMTALLLLIFKDSILGFVASIQLSVNDMVRIGDWIEMRDYGADGDVIDMSLNTVKVRNWDKTITTIPTYALMAHSFKNWRGMEESGGRRIKRALHIDLASVKFCDDAMIERFGNIALIADYVAERSAEIEAANRAADVDTDVAINGRRMTNLGTFRRYVERYVASRAEIHKDMTMLVRQLPPTEHGIPIEVYAFSKDQAWAHYEAIQADIFDHLFAAVSQFDLEVFQRPSGHDLRQLKS